MKALFYLTFIIAVVLLTLIGNLVEGKAAIIGFLLVLITFSPALLFLYRRAGIN